VGGFESGVWGAQNPRETRRAGRRCVPLAVIWRR
jgi:hypothetical protein